MMMVTMTVLDYDDDDDEQYRYCIPDSTRYSLHP